MTPTTFLEATVYLAIFTLAATITAIIRYERHQP